jgi:hypothetical protein
MDDVGEYWYKNANNDLLRVQRTGTPFMKDLHRADVVLSLEQLRKEL